MPPTTRQTSTPDATRSWRSVIHPLAWVGRPFSIRVEASIVAAVLLIWQAARIPVAGGTREALRHAHQWLTLEHTLGLTGLQNGVISLVHHRTILPAANWSYVNLHIFAIFAFMVALRAAAPDTYPRVRTAFVLLHIPALIAIAAFPLASPFWLPHLPAWAGTHPALTGSLSADLRNQTATVASEHFGYPFLIALGTLWATHRQGGWARWAIALYPVWVFIFIVGIGRHYPLDAAVGALCVVFGFAAAHLLHRSGSGAPAAFGATPEPLPRWVALALGAGLSAGWVNGLVAGNVRITHPTLLDFAAPMGAAIAFAVARRTRRKTPDV